MLQESIGLSVVLGFLASEFLGISAGGLVSPGYLALFLEQPLRLASTLALALAIFLAVRLLDRFVIIYGRRRFMATILLGLLGTWLLERALFASATMGADLPFGADLRAVGYIIPGLIANDMLRQGILKTVALTLLCAVLVRLVLMLVALA